MPVRSGQARSDQSGTGAPRTPPTIAPTTGLGAALAMLPSPWTVFRQGGLSPFEFTGGEIYGGLYIALHPERGVALVDLAPAQPGRALPRLRALLREAGLAEFSTEPAPVIAVVMTRDELRTVSLRLGKAFEAAPLIKNRTWVKVAAAALMARFPDLRQVQRAGDAPTSPEPEAEAAPQSEAETPIPMSPPAAAAPQPAAPQPAPPQPRARPAREPRPRAAQPREPRPAAAAAPARMRLTADEPITARDAGPRAYSRPPVSPGLDEHDPEPPSAAWYRGGRRLIQAVVAVGGLAAAAVILLLLRHAGVPVADTGAPPASNVSVRIAPTSPPPAPAPTVAAPTAPAAAPPVTPAPEQAVTTPPPASVQPPGVAPPPADIGAPSSAAVAPSTPGAPLPVVRIPAPPQTANTAPLTAPTKLIPEPPSAPLVKAPVAKARAPKPSAPSAEASPAIKPEVKKAPAAQTPAVATREDRARRRAAEQPAIPPEDTVTIDGITYVKGREPHMLGAAPAAAPEAGASPPAPPPAADAAPDQTPGSITLTPAPAPPTQVSPGTAQGMPP